MSLLKRLKVKVRNARRSKEVLAHQRRAAGAGEGGETQQIDSTARCCFGPVLLSWKVSLVIWAVVTDLRILGYDVLLSAIITVICDLLPKHC